MRSEQTYGRRTCRWSLSMQLSGVVDFDAKVNSLKGKWVNRNA